MVLISPSILSADFTRLGEQVKRVQNAGADMIHIDVMDGVFVPNISVGIPVVKAVRNITDLPLDVHLMIIEPDRFLEDFANAGADILTVHVETTKHLDRTLNTISSLGIRPGVALNPHTPLCWIENIHHLIDLVLIMSVNPGFSGQVFLPYTLKKVEKLKAILKGDVKISIDGGINTTNVPQAVKSGVDIIVAGSAIFFNGDIEGNMKRIRESTLI